MLNGFLGVPRAGVEPARPKSLVFETNASTNSATWAYVPVNLKQSHRFDQRGYSRFSRDNLGFYEIGMQRCLKKLILPIDNQKLIFNMLKSSSVSFDQALMACFNPLPSPSYENKPQAYLQIMPWCQPIHRQTAQSACSYSVRLHYPNDCR